MISAVFVARHGIEVVVMDTSMNDLISRAGASLEYERLPTESIGSMLLTLTNVVVGSRVNIRDQAGTTTIYDGEAASSSVSVSIPVYAIGSSLNDLRIKVRKASGSPNYIPYETLTTAVVGTQSIYVSQIPDE